MKNKFRVKDLYLSAYLFAIGKNLEYVERENGICWFVFKGAKDCASRINDYWADKAICNPRLYTDAIRTLKDRIFSEK